MGPQRPPTSRFAARESGIACGATRAEDQEHRVGDRLSSACAVLGLAGGHRQATEVIRDRVGELLAIEAGASDLGYEVDRFGGVEGELDAAGGLRAAVWRDHELGLDLEL